MEIPNVSNWLNYPVEILKNNLVKPFNALTQKSKIVVVATSVLALFALTYFVFKKIKARKIESPKIPAKKPPQNPATGKEQPKVSQPAKLPEQSSSEKDKPGTTDSTPKAPIVGGQPEAPKKGEPSPTVDKIMFSTEKLLNGDPSLENDSTKKIIRNLQNYRTLRSLKPQETPKIDESIEEEEGLDDSSVRRKLMFPTPAKKKIETDLNKDADGVITLKESMRRLEGDFTVDGEMFNGKGRVFDPMNDNIYDAGTFKEGLLHDPKGVRVSAIDKHIGNFVKGVLQGHGLHFREDGMVYDGDFKNGQYDGVGIYWSSSDESSRVKIFEGTYKDGFIHQGILNFGEYIIEGSFEKDALVRGKRTNTETKVVEEGDFKDDQLIKGEIIHPDGRKESVDLTKELPKDLQNDSSFGEGLSPIKTLEE